MSNNYILKSNDNQSIQVTAFGQEHLKSGKCIILVHGFKGFKDWGYGPFAGKLFSDNGFFVITFNFSHNGIGNNPIEFTELEKFSKNTFSREIEELSDVVDAYISGFFGEVKNPKIGLLGHSRGGAIAILTARRRMNVNAVAMWASVAKLDRYSERQKEEWRKKGVFEVMNMRTKQVMSLNLTLLDDIEKNKNDLLNIEKAVSSFNRPLLIAHGNQDLAVPIKEADQLFEWSDKSMTEFYALSATGHTFNIQHPFNGTNEKFDKLMNKTIEFFKTNLN